MSTEQPNSVAQHCSKLCKTSYNDSVGQWSTKNAASHIIISALSPAPAGIRRFSKSGRNPARAKIQPAPDAFVRFEKMSKSNFNSIFLYKNPRLVYGFEKRFEYFYLCTCLVTLAVYDFVTVVPRKSAT